MGSAGFQDTNLWARIRGFDNSGGFLAANGLGRAGRVWFVDAQNGANGNTGRAWNKAFATVAKAFSMIDSYDTVVLMGVIREQGVNAPLGVHDVTLLGAGNKPRQATSNGVPTGGGATWLPLASPTATTPLLRLREQAWTLRNIFMAAHTDASCVETRRAEDATYPDASHATFENMVFGGGLYGIQDIGGSGFLTIRDCEFRDFTGSSAYAIRNTSTAIAVPLRWRVLGNLFRNNKNHILSPMSSASIGHNDFGIVGNTITTVIACSLTGGSNNSVFLNILNRPQNSSPNATLYVGGSNDLWTHNFGTDAVIYGVPDNS